MKVYLAGPITGTSYAECTVWRENAAVKLKQAGFDVISPMRGKAFLEKETSLKDAYDHIAVATKHAIFTRDKFDCTRSKVAFFNFLGAKTVSIGSIMELAWGHLSGSFCVVVMEEDNPHNHAFVREAASVILHNLDEAVDYVIHTFGGEARKC